MDIEMKELPGPYEIFELADGETRTLEIEGWGIGKMKIVTAKAPQGKYIQALRIVCTPATKPQGVPWYDITSQTLIAQMLPYLEPGTFQGKKFVVTKHGVAPWARFTLGVTG